ncbi:MAG: TonB family protein [Saprospiraceae bacterium]|nr:TonB family protein [Saprospiraceae bacterium]
MRAVVNQEENRTKAAIGSTLFHALLLALLFFYVLPAPNTTPEVSTIELDFGGGGGDNAAAGEPDKGMNDDYTPLGEEPAPTPTKSESAPDPAPTPTKSNATPPPPTATSDDPDVAAMKQQKEQDRKKQAEADQQERARQAEVDRQRAAAEDAKRAEQAKRDKVKSNAGSAFGKPGSSGQGAGGGGKPGNGGINGGTGDNPFGKSSGTGGGTGGGDGTGDGPSIGGGLGGRKVERRGAIKDNSQKSGKVVIEVCVNSSGSVVSADYKLQGSTTSDSELKSKALQAAKGYRFAPSTADQQCGTITFNFTLK